MSDHIQQTIADLQARLDQQEAAVRKTRLLINQLCELIGQPALYPEAEDHAASVAGAAASAIRVQPDEFFGKPLASSVRRVLELRKAAGLEPPAVEEVYAVLKQGGFDFPTQDEDNALRGLQVSVSKNTTTFVRLPSGRIGLAEWYDRVRIPKPRRTSNGSALTPQSGAEDAPSSVDDPMSIAVDAGETRETEP